MNKHFLSIKINAEKGDGPKIAKRYGVRGFPTLLIVDAAGDEVDRVVGYRPPKPFIAAVKEALGPGSFAALKKTAEKDAANYEAIVKLAKKYEDRSDYDRTEELCRRVLAAEKAPPSFRGQAEARLSLLGYFKSRGRDVAKVEEYFEKHKESDRVVDHARILFSQYQRRNETAKVTTVAEYLLDHGLGDDASFLNNYAWYLATHDARLKRALELARKAVELSPKTSYILDTLAEAYFRNGMYEKAVKTQERAVEHAASERKEAFEKRLGEFRKALTKSRKESKEL